MIQEVAVDIAAGSAEKSDGGVMLNLIPREGAQMWFDSFVIPADAPHPQEALEFINFMIRPEIAAMNTNYVSYASGNFAAKQHIDKDILDNPGIYPDEATMKRLFTNTAYDERSQRTVTRLWTKVKTGR